MKQLRFWQLCNQSYIYSNRLLLTVITTTRLIQSFQAIKLNSFNSKFFKQLCNQHLEI